MGDEHHGLGGARQDLGNLALELLARDGVERAERLVQQQDLRVERERAGDADALLHAARQLMRIVVRKAVQADETHEARDALTGLGGFNAGDLEPEGDVLGDRQPGKQVELLEHHRARRRGLLNPPARHRDGAARRGLQAVQDAQQGGLAAAARADDRDELARAHVETHVAQHLKIVPPALAREDLADILDLQHRVWAAPARLRF